ncbi:MAG: molecular chaperone HtpG [Gammaproteobacteria bacterium]|nr:molecular chaperone HtpG [Gammaproteobacteria bacterium]
MSQNKETRSFETETRQLLQLMIHSMYSNKDIFLRELISNASDALDKLRFEGLEAPELLESGQDLAIQVSSDEAAGTVTIRDNGIGMSRDEVVTNIGTIAHSGTREFAAHLTGDSEQDSNLIGQFGVGFYSAFLVADRVTLTTRRAGSDPSEGVRWLSSGEGEYDLEAADCPQPGTEVVLHLRDDSRDYLADIRLRSIIKKYSDHITFPILMPSKAPVSESEDGETVIEAETEMQVVNQATALWTRPRTEIEKSEYEEFYKQVSNDFENPLCYAHNRVEGSQEYTSLLYIPSRAPFDLWDRDRRHGIKLYINRVFIMDDAEQLLPGYLRFVRGVVDSADLPLNVSREILQNNKLIESMRAGCTKRVLGMLDEMASQRVEEYLKFWSTFGVVLKEGAIEDHANQTRIAKLLRFSTTFDGQPDPKITLMDYVARMPEEQEAIYYITAESHRGALHSPHLEIFKKKGVEVLLLSDKIDEWLVGALSEFEGIPLVSVAKGDLDLSKLGEQADAEEEGSSEEQTTVLEHMSKVLENKVQAVRITNRLTDSVACLVAQENGMSGNLERILKNAGQSAPESKPILEVNPKHILFQRASKAESEEMDFMDWVFVIYDQALLSEGGHLDNPAQFVKRMNRLLLAPEASS